MMPRKESGLTSQSIKKKEKKKGQGISKIYCNQKQKEGGKKAINSRKVSWVLSLQISTLFLFVQLNGIPKILHFH